MDVASHQFQVPLSIPQSGASIDKPTHALLQQQSVIQTNQQLQQQLQSMHDSDDPAGHKRREILTRRPSYRKILDDLAGDGPVKMENYEDTGSSAASSPTNPTDDTNIVSSTSGIVTNDKTQQPPQLPQPPQPQPQPTQPQQQNVSQPQQQFQNINLNGVVGSLGGNVVQLPDGAQTTADNTQYIIATQVPGNKIQAYTIKGQLPVGLDNTALASPQQLAEEANRKREMRLYKNREAARECRRKKKEYVKCLENRVAVLENQNKALIEELKSFKDLYCNKTD